jgi:hypothetical protein
MHSVALYFQWHSMGGKRFAVVSHVCAYKSCLTRFLYSNLPLKLGLLTSRRSKIYASRLSYFSMDASAQPRLCERSACFAMSALPCSICTQEYDQCYQLVKECDQHARIAYNPDDADSFSCVSSLGLIASPFIILNRSLGQLMAHLLPLLMMRHRRIPRAKWRDKISPSGKHWIEQAGRTIKHVYSHLT